MHMKFGLIGQAVSEEEMFVIVDEDDHDGDDNGWLVVLLFNRSAISHHFLSIYLSLLSR